MITRQDIQQLLKTDNVEEFRDYWRVKFLFFKEARAFVRNLKLKNKEDWLQYCKSGKKPYYIPVSPYRVYENEGWNGLCDWLGIDKRGRKGPLRTFEEARTFIRKLKLKNWKAWFDFSQSDNLPDDIPVSPAVSYKNKGWINLQDWLGTTKRTFRPFKEARAFVRNLNLKNWNDWNDYVKNGKPFDIPAVPFQVRCYQKDWINRYDWLGVNFKTFKKARVFSRSLNLKSWTEWQAFCKSGKNPRDIPLSPNLIYQNRGWVDVADWLGTRICRNRWGCK